MSRTVAFILLVLLSTVGLAEAQTAVVVEKYVFYDAATKAQDQACRRLGVRFLSENGVGGGVKGLTRVAFKMPNYWDSGVPGLRFFSYGGISFQSRFGDTTGHMLCILRPASGMVLEIAFEFQHPGLGGFPSIVPNIVNPSPNYTRRQTYVVSQPTPIAGAN